MANLFANYAFNQDNLDLSRFYYNSSLFKLYDNLNTTYNGVRYSDVYGILWSLNGETYLSGFAGYNFTANSNDVITGGVAQAYVEVAWTGSSWVEMYGVQGISVPAMSIYYGATTRSTNDDYSLFQQWLSGDDTFNLSSGVDVAYGYDGNDTMTGNGSGDTLYGGAGNDELYGGEGNDTLYGGDGNDEIYTGLGNDYAYGGSGDDDINGYLTPEGEYDYTYWTSSGTQWLYGNDGNDTIIGGSDVDNIDGGIGNDFLVGLEGNDVINGGEGNDTLDGDDGNDEINTGPGNDYAYGGSGDDEINGFLTPEGEYAYDFSSSSGTQWLYGNDGNDTIIGGSDVDNIEGGIGNDYIFGRKGNDVIGGGEGNDQLDGWYGDDKLYGGAGNDQIFTGPGNDYAYGGSGDDDINGSLTPEGEYFYDYWASSGTQWLYGNDGNDTIIGGSDVDNIEGGIGNDYLDGLEGNDVITGGEGNDTLDGDDGNDNIFADGGSDTIYGGTGIDTIKYNFSRLNYTLTLGDGNSTVKEKNTGTNDTFSTIERVVFSDKTVAIDIGVGEIGGSCYRIYKAAFNRTPDEGGLGYWIGQMDLGKTLVEVSAGFIDSDEFRASYGTNPTNGEFLTKVYNNVLGRDPDSGGYDWWVDQLTNNPEKTWDKVMADFSEGSENVENTDSLINNGISYDLWVA